MTPNTTLSIPNAPEDRAAGRLLREHGDDRLARWRRRPAARHLTGFFHAAVGVQGRRARATGARSSCASSWRRAGSRTGSTSPASACCRRCAKLLEQPFWLDPSDPHRMAAVMQILTRPHDCNYRVRATIGDSALHLVDGERLGQGRPPRRRRGHQPRAGGRRGDRPHQRDPVRSSQPSPRPLRPGRVAKTLPEDRERCGPGYPCRQRMSEPYSGII